MSHTTFTVSINDREVPLPALAVPVGPGQTRAAVSQIGLVAAIATHMALDLTSAEDSAIAYDTEEALAARYKLEPAVFLRPPQVPIQASGAYRYIPVPLDMDAIAATAKTIFDQLLDPAGRQAYDQYYTVRAANPLEPRLAVSVICLEEPASRFCREHNIPQSAQAEVERALKRELIRLGMVEDNSGYSLAIALPFDKAAGVDRMVESHLAGLGDDKVDLWRLADEYIEGGYGISVGWRAVLNQYQSDSGAPGWVVRDVIGYLLTHDYIIRTQAYQPAAELIEKVAPEDIQAAIDTGNGVYDEPIAAWRHYLAYGKAEVRPFIFPDVDEAIAVLRDCWTPTHRYVGELAIVEDDLLEKLSERYNRKITAGDVQFALSQPGSALYRAFMRQRASLNRTDIPMPSKKDPDVRRYAYIYPGRVSREGFDGDRHRTRLGEGSGSHIPVHVLQLLAGGHNEVYLLTVTGPREAIAAAFARLFSGSSRKKYSTSFSAGGYHSLYPLDRANYDHLRSRIPETRNLMIMTLLAHSAVPAKFSQEDSRFIVLTQESEVNNVPAQFIGMLDRAIALPLLPSWAGYLWREGVDRNLIRPLPKQIGDTAGWEVGTETALSTYHDRTWHSIIRDGLQGGAIAVQGEGDIQIRELPPEHTAMEITNRTIEQSLIRLSREAVGIPVAGD